MYVINSYPVAVIMCVVTMICWGSWANTQKLASKQWSFPLFYWDYSLGIVLLSLVMGLSMGSIGTQGQSFIQSLTQASGMAILLALTGGVVFNIANLLLVAAIDIAGMAIAFPVGIGLALVIGVLVNYFAIPVGNPVLLFAGVAFVVLAIILDALAYKKILKGGTSTKGIIISLSAGVLMGFFFRFVAASMSENFEVPVLGLLTPYSAIFLFSIGIFLSNFLFNSYFMYRPISGNKSTFSDYFKKGSAQLHLTGILGGVIWCLGMLFSLIASGKAGFAISYGLGQGATMVAAIWGVFVWKEFKNAPQGTSKFLTSMFIFFVVGLALIILSKLA